MNWKELKARLLAIGGVRVTGEPIDCYIERSLAGPSAKSAGSVFFAIGERRVRLGLDPTSPIELLHRGNGSAVLLLEHERIEGRLEAAALHCPRQAYITVSEGCIFSCRYCQVPSQEKKVKTPEEVAALVESVIDRIDAISLTSGVVGSVEEDEQRVLAIVKRLQDMRKPIGVSIYPTPYTPARLADLGVAEVKFNVEAATKELFNRMCPGLDWDAVWRALSDSVRLFGRNHVFSNVILGLGETDGEMEACIDRLTSMGVIPVIRPLNPVAALTHLPRPSPERITRMCTYLERAIEAASLDTGAALTMCTACTGCDLVPGRDT